MTEEGSDDQETGADAGDTTTDDVAAPAETPPPQEPTPSADLTLKVLSGSDDVTVNVRTTEAPGPSGFVLGAGVESVARPHLLPEIGGSELESKDTLKAFLRRFVGGESPVDVTCARPRIERLCALLDASPLSTEIEVKLGSIA